MSVEIRRRGRDWVVVWEMTADECESLAHFMGSDSWGEDLYAAADELRRLAEPDPDANGLRLGVVMHSVAGASGGADKEQQ